MTASFVQAIKDVYVVLSGEHGVDRIVPLSNSKPFAKKALEFNEVGLQFQCT